MGVFVVTMLIYENKWGANISLVLRGQNIRNHKFADSSVCDVHCLLQYSERLLLGFQNYAEVSQEQLT